MSESRRWMDISFCRFSSIFLYLAICRFTEKVKRFLLTFVSMMTFVSCDQKGNPFLSEWNTPYGLPPFDQIKYEHYMPAIREGIARQKAQVEAIATNPEPPTFANTVEAYELSGELLAKVEGVLYNLSLSDNSPELEEIMEEATPLLAELEDEIFLDSRLFRRVRTLYEGDQSNCTREQQILLKKLYRAFELNGVGLSAERQNRLREINKGIAVAQQKFSNHLLAENNAFEKECGVEVSAYGDTMTTCPDRSFREKMFRAYSSRGNHDDGNDNKQLVLDIMKLRAEKAEMLGFRNFASYQLADKMAGKPETVNCFLEEIMSCCMEKARGDVAQMQKLMDEDIAAGLLPAGSFIQPWDWFYYAEKLRKIEYDFDEEQVRPYFQLDNVRKGAFAAAHQLYGIDIESLPADRSRFGVPSEGGVPVYHPEVEAFKVTDADGSLLGIFYTDYLPRASKSGGAWMNNVREQYHDAKGENVRPVIVNVCNLAKPSVNVEGKEIPSILTLDQVTTVFHEFGHALHGLLTQCHYHDVSGTSVAQDFVETFSQFNENWAFQPEILKKYAFHYCSGELIPAELVEKIHAASHFNQGFLTGEVTAASILDMKWHELTLTELQSLTISDIAAIENRFCKEMGLIAEMIPRYRSTYFGHIFDNDYCAGYYGYQWSEVLDQDAFAYFKENGLYNPEIAMRFRKIFLEKGGSEEPMLLYRQFRGQEPDPHAFLRARGLME